MAKKPFIIAASIILAAISILVIYKTVANSFSPNRMAGMRVDDKLTFKNAEKLNAEGDKEGAVKNLAELMMRYPESPNAESAAFMLASIYEEVGELLKAREIYQKVLDGSSVPDSIVRAQEALGNLNIKILFSPTITQDAVIYEIQKGDTLKGIAKKFNTTIDLIIRTNALKDEKIKYGRRLKIAKSKFSIAVDESQNILTLKADGNIFKTYRISTGLNNSTPMGNFTITTKIMNPVWYTEAAVVPAGSPNNILGSRWMAISRKGYGIHGTADPKSIGKSITAGCVRMANPDVEELYTIVPEGTEVVIVD